MLSEVRNDTNKRVDADAAGNEDYFAKGLYMYVGELYLLV